MRAVRFNEYGDEDVLDVRQVENPRVAPGRVLVRVKAAAINPGENYIRSGAAAAMFPTTFPSGQGSDLAGEIVALGEGVTGFTVGQAVLGWTDERASHAELVAVPADHLIPKPQALSWEVAGSMCIAPMAALASVRAVAPKPGETVVVSAAAGGVGSVAVQLVRRTGATVIGLAGEQNHAWLRAHGVIPVSYGEGQADRIREAANDRLDAFIDTFGSGYVDLALALGITPSRISTIIDLGAAKKHGVPFITGGDIASVETLGELAALVAAGDLEIPIARTYSLDRVRDAYRDLADRHTHGKIVLRP
jgi:NADPH:quinone reductase-like Zn-dependent oxidoreductase